MERKSNEKSKSNKLLTNLNFSQTKEAKDQNQDKPSKLKSHKFDHLIDYDFEEKVKKFFDDKKFTIGNQFDQKGSEKFLAEKDECLKFMDLDNTTLDDKNKNLKKSKKKHRSKNKDEKIKLDHDLKYISEIKFIEENVESFLSEESSIQILNQFDSKSNEEK